MVHHATAQCNEFTSAGALKGSTPCEVVELCDITFSCIADSSALKDVCFFFFFIFFIFFFFTPFFFSFFRVTCSLNDLKASLQINQDHCTPPCILAFAVGVRHVWSAAGHQQRKGLCGPFKCRRGNHQRRA